MRARFLLWFLLSCAVGALPAVASCGGEETVSRLPPREPTDPGDDDDDDVNTPGRDARADARLPDAGLPEGRVYAHTTNTLFLFEPLSRALTQIGRFSCLNGAEAVIDIAVDRSGAMYATTFRRFLAVDPITATCTEIAAAEAGTIDYPNSLSFVPAGTVDIGREALVGYATSPGNSIAVSYVRIDLDTGAMTTLGNMNASAAGTQYRSSGDLISLIHDEKKTYVTVKVQPTPGNDLLAEINPANGNLKRIIGDIGFRNLYGLGYWGAKAYGFTDTGEIVEIDMADGKGTLVDTLEDGGKGIPWYGAGVTTEAPVRR